MRYLLPLIIALLLATPAQADVRRGAALHETHCTACHNKLVDGDGTLLYTRGDRKIHAFPALRTQVQRCQSSQRLQWRDEEVDDVAAYLNAAYYHFKP